MFSPDDIEYVGPVVGGVLLIFRGGYSDDGRRTRQVVELDLAAARKLCERLNEWLEAPRG